MCGIAGIFDLLGRRDYSRDLVQRLNDIQYHRGPDEGGLHLEPGVALAHRRLSVIDIATGQQPLFNEDGSVSIVFNGEIYNYQSLVPELEMLGHRFHTRSDTEVIVHAWEEWGQDCVNRLRGMFAFAIHDRKANSLFIARDRMGVKPMHYAVLSDGSLVFGSELKVVTAHPAFVRALDPLAVEEYIALGYVADPRTIYSTAHKLPAAHSLLIERGKPVGEPKPYWDVHFTVDSKLTWEDAQTELLERVKESVRLRMIAEVPLGAFLSGGVDSSAVVAAMAGVSPGPVRTCAIGFDDPAFNETEFAAQVAQRYGTDHHVEHVNTDDFDLVDTLAHLYDEPYADSSAIPTYRVCQLARRHVTVALSGDGGDETFGGYRRYRLHVMEEALRSRLPAAVRQPFFGALGRIYPKADWAPRSLRAKTTFQALAKNSVDAYCHSMALIRPDERVGLYDEAFLSELGGYRAEDLFRLHAAKAGTDDPLALIQYIDYKTYLVGDINTKVDRASMAHALEVREPLMDHELIEWMATLPSAMKTDGRASKRLLKSAFEPLLPADVLYRPKMGFSVPMARWLRGPLAERLREAVLGERLAGTGVFKHESLKAMIDAHVEGRRDYAAPLWSLLMFDAFLRLQEKSAA